MQRDAIRSAKRDVADSLSAEVAKWRRVADFRRDPGAIVEFLIRRSDHGDWDSGTALDPEICRPAGLPWRPLSDPGAGPGFEVDGTSFQFIDEMPGIQVIVEGGALDRAHVTGILEEVVRRMGEATGTPGYLLDTDSFGNAPIALAGPSEPHPATAKDYEARANPRATGLPMCRGRELLIHCAMAGVVIGLAIARAWIGAAVVLGLWSVWGLTEARARAQQRTRQQGNLAPRVTLIQAAAAGTLTGLSCPTCARPAISVRFTHPAEGEYRTWFVCSSCDFEMRAQNSGRPAYFAEALRDGALEARDRE